MMFPVIRFKLQSELVISLYVFMFNTCIILS